MEKIDLFREHRDEYSLDTQPHLVDVRAGTYLTVSGTGAPGDAEFQKKLGALYGTAYTIKFDNKRRHGRDFKVGMLEGLWWTKAGGEDFLDTPRDAWHWKLLLRVPSYVTSRAVAAALKTLKEKGKLVAAVKRETIREGRSLQALHVGAYADEPRTLARMDEFAREHRLRFRGKHHEIYLSDPRRVPPSRQRTILRHPVTRAAIRATS